MFPILILQFVVWMFCSGSFACANCVGQSDADQAVDFFAGFSTPDIAFWNWVFSWNTGPGIGWDKGGSQGAKFKEVLILRVMGVHGWQLHDPKIKHRLKILAFLLSCPTPGPVEILIQLRVGLDLLWEIFQTAVTPTFSSLGTLPFQFQSSQKLPLPGDWWARGTPSFLGDSGLLIHCSGASADRTWSILHLVKTAGTLKVSRGTLPEINNF